MNKISIFIGYLTSAVGIVGSILLQPLLLHSLGASGFVKWNEVIIYTGYVSNVLVSFQNYSTISIARDLERDYKGIIIQARVAILMLFLLVVACLLFSNFVGYFNYVYIFVVSLVFVKAFYDLDLSYYYGMQRPICPKIYELLSKSTSAISIFVVAYYLLNVDVGLLLYFFSMATMSSALFIYGKLGRSKIITPHMSISDMNLHSNLIFFKNVFPFVICNIPNILLMSIFVILISRLDSEMAVIYIFYFKLYSIVNISFGILSSIYGPKWASLVGKRDFLSLHNSFVILILFVFISVAFVMVLMAIFGESIFNLWLGMAIKGIALKTLLFFSFYYFVLVFRLAYYLFVSSISLAIKDAMYFVVDICVHAFILYYFINIKQYSMCFILASLYLIISSLIHYRLLLSPVKKKLY